MGMNYITTPLSNKNMNKLTTNNKNAIRKSLHYTSECMSNIFADTVTFNAYNK